MIVCVCQRISEREIAARARAGMDFDEIQFELCVSAQCGKCEHHARAIVEQCRAEMTPTVAKTRVDAPLGPFGCGLSPQL